MLSRALRTVTVSLIVLGGSAFAAPLAHAQETTTTVAATTTVAEVTSDSIAATTAEAPTGGVSAGGGFLADDEGGTNIPLVVGSAAVLAGVGYVLVRRRKA